MLKNSEDSSFVSGTVSDENGSFTIRKPQNQKCYLLFSGIGYYDHKISLEQQQGNSVNIGNIIMEPDEKQLKEVVVTGKRRVIFQNGEYKLAVSGLSLEKLPDVYSILSFLPFVTVNDDKVSMVGKGKILILITNSVRYAVSDSGDMRSLVFQVFLRLQS